MVVREGSPGMVPVVVDVKAAVGIAISCGGVGAGAGAMGRALFSLERFLSILQLFVFFALFFIPQTFLVNQSLRFQFGHFRS